MNTRFRRLAPLVWLLCVGAGTSDLVAAGTMAKHPFGKTAQGTPVELYTLTNKGGAVAKITNYGGIVVSLLVPDRDGRLGDVVLGYDDLQGYLDENPYFGCIVGRYGNRIANGSFSLDGKTYSLAINNSPNHLHGGNVGFDKVVWNAEPQYLDEVLSLVLTHLSPDGDEGYPGNLNVKVVYTLTDENVLRIEMSATTDQATVVNLTHHSYFNLAGAGNGTILDHEVVIDADSFTPVDETLIPTGKLMPVEGTPLDFRTPHSIGARIDEDHEQMKIGAGYDHNYVLNKDAGGAPTRAARVTEATSGRVMEVYTTDPGVQFYTGNFLDGTIVGKGGARYPRRSGFCLEPQHYPDSPNKPDFPSTVLNPGDEYNHTIEYRFLAE